MDSFRIGAQEQLKTLGRILNVPVSHVGAGQSLEEALQPLSKKRVVLVDTAGLPASDPVLALQLDNLVSRKLPIRNYLVLAATSQHQVLKAAWHAYKRCGLAGCIITKLDEAVSMGEVLGMAIGQGLPVAYTTDGPKFLMTSRCHAVISWSAVLCVCKIRMNLQRKSWPSFIRVRVRRHVMLFERLIGN